MIPINGSIRLALISIVVFIWSCSKDDYTIENKTATGKTSLFEKVTEPESDEMNRSLDAMFSEASFSGLASGDPTTGDWGDGNPNGQLEPGVLTAGEWSDLNNWDFWNNLLSNQEYYEDVNKWNLKEIKRYSFVVSDKNQSFVANAEITLISKKVEVWKTKTDSKGRATLWSDLDLDGLTALIKFEDTIVIVADVKAYAEGINNVTINKTIDNKKIMDIYFAVDATGSMGDEINYLKVELNNVIKRIKQNNPLLEMRFGSVFYRDKGDDYVTRDLNFSTDETSLISFISNQSANGGGDFPEAVHSALDVAISQNSWNDNASARIMFLLLDAPPHYTQEVISSLELNLIKAAEKGIKIIPITASGIDKATEYLMRSFAILTNGTYVFITDDSGIGNDHLEATIGNFEVEKLNDLMVRLVGEYIP
ncbi:von Willebrand factor type A domain-containing protein [Mariniflexile fucanivorans]|uniref:von Willebrand factor type A domain-containing protein n=1 Tax=Mariniflexile fucanivorans TaxID=264023 RepID=A0A4R1RMB9_9FLAO|nr:VWA domain-containing protein [Mariniflexile fucanivorans]TCL67020.1 von Willebrand factor type A domain-containing protein [Mariniflexile fucanivorans]